MVDAGGGRLSAALGTAAADRTCGRAPCRRSALLFRGTLDEQSTHDGREGQREYLFPSRESVWAAKRDRSLRPRGT